MKAKHISHRAMVIFCLIFFSSNAAISDESARILIIITGNQPAAMEMRLGKYLLKANYQVALSDELTPSPRLTAEEIFSIKKGNIAKARKAAALNETSLIFIGSAKTESNSGEVLGMKMEKVATTISYKIVETVSGRILDMDSMQNYSAGRSAEEAKHTSFDNVAVDIAKAIGEKIPFRISANERNLLAQFRKRFNKTETIISSIPSPKKTVSVPAPKRRPKKTVAASASPRQTLPQIIITEPPMTRGFKVLERKRTVTIKGVAVDSSGIQFVKINGDHVDNDTEGRFTYEAELLPGDNHFLIAAKNKIGNISEKDIFITHPKDTIPPKIILTNARKTRGLTRDFKIVKKSQRVEKALVEGMVKDESGILYLKVNGENISLDQGGHFSEMIALSKGERKIVIDAADKVGNKTSKAFQIAKGKTRATGGSDESFSRISRGRPVLWGLAIGVSRYENSSLELQFADKDALSLAQFLEEQEGQLFSEVRFKSLINENATRDRIIQGMTSHLGKAGPDDIVFIFIAGHGIKHQRSGSYYFVPYNADSESLLSKGLRMSDFEEAVKILSKDVNKVIIVMDTCHSGAMRIGVRATGDGQNLAEALKEASGLFILSASKGGEESLEDEKYRLHERDSGHGAFTYALIKGMSGKANYDGDEYISLSELFQYVAKQVPRMTDGRQHPYFRTEGTDMPFILMENKLNN